MTHADDWFLASEERSNGSSSIDAHHGSMAWTEGNSITALVDGATYFARLSAVFNEMQSGDLLLFTDWRGDGDERLVDDLSVTRALVALCRRGGDVRGLVWRAPTGPPSFRADEKPRPADAGASAG